MRLSHLVMASSIALLAACSSTESTAPLTTPSIDSRLAAVASTPVFTAAASNVSMRVSVTSNLPETVSGSVCAQTIEARQPSATSWTDVTTSINACPAMAVQLQPGGTLNIDAVGDPQKIRAVATSGSTVVLRARHTLAGSASTYTLQSNEITWTVP